MRLSQRQKRIAGAESDETIAGVAVVEGKTDVKEEEGSGSATVSGL